MTETTGGTIICPHFEWKDSPSPTKSGSIGILAPGWEAKVHSIHAYWKCVHQRGTLSQWVLLILPLTVTSQKSLNDLALKKQSIFVYIFVLDFHSQQFIYKYKREIQILIFE